MQMQSHYVVNIRLVALVLFYDRMVQMNCRPLIIIQYILYNNNPISILPHLISNAATLITKLIIRKIQIYAYDSRSHSLLNIYIKTDVEPNAYYFSIRRNSLKSLTISFTHQIAVSNAPSLYN